MCHCNADFQFHSGVFLRGAMRNIQLFSLAIFITLWPTASPLRAQTPDSKADVLVIDAKAPAHPFPHFWEQMFGSGRAILSLRQDYRTDLGLVKQATDFTYIRFHGIFNDEVGIYTEDAQG